jgi:outer membrane protein OmpA-like peptidoglycan-associated protein
MDEYTQLRKLLLEQEQQRLSRLEQRLDDRRQRSQETATILPDALQLAPDPQALITALQTPVDRCVKQSVEKDPRTFVKAIWPIMGPELRKQIAEAFKSIREFLQAHQEQLDGLAHRLAGLEQEKIQSLVVQLQQIEQALTSLQNTTHDEKTKVEELTKRLRLLEPILARLRELEAAQKDTDRLTQEVAYILPKAIRQATQQRPDSIEGEFADPELAEALRIPVELCIKQSISQNTRTFADTLFPVMGPAIRKSIHESLKSLIQSINRSLEQSLSVRGVMWRLEALRTGRPFAEIVLQKTLAYRVEQVFLIHRESGLLMQHLCQEEINAGDSDAVSAMLTAIQDFIRDSFSASKTEELDSVEIGEYTVWLERGPAAVLACVIRGIAPYDFRHLMRSLLELLHAKYGRSLEHFSGDTTVLEPARPLLQRTLQAKLKPGAEVPKKLFSLKFALLFVLSIVGFIGWGYWEWQFFHRLAPYLEKLQQTPGIVVVEHDYQGHQLVIRGLRDPLAVAPQTLVQSFAVEPVELKETWGFYHDLSPVFVEQRLRQWLKAPKTVQWQLQEATLSLSGHAPKSWINRVLNVSGAVAGIDHVKADELLDTDRFLLIQAQRILNPPASIILTVKDSVLKAQGFADTATREMLQQRSKTLQGFTHIDFSELLDDPKEVFAKVIKSVEKISIYFYGNDEFASGQDILFQTCLNDIKQLIALSQDLSQPIRLQITGHTDGLGSQTYNQQLSQQRSEAVYQWLINNGIAADYLEVVPLKVIRFNEK